MFCCCCTVDAFVIIMFNGIAWCDIFIYLAPSFSPVNFMWWASRCVLEPRSCRLGLPPINTGFVIFQFPPQKNPRLISQALKSQKISPVRPHENLFGYILFSAPVVDVIIYLVNGDRNVCFRRIKAKDLIAEEFEGAMHWEVCLQPLKSAL